ncbi:hypothetical protein [Saccharopolyspora sp. 5N708]|uniref:hypothetical protein n=1 Tax=Saccharopolyspora sp. 5N708 TaxID=3457424 RepID=UPI003FCF72C3
MPSVKRVIAAAALGLPLLLGAPGMALANDGHSSDGKPCHSKKCHKDGQKIDQDQDSSTEQSNDNKSPIFQWSIGSKGDQSALNWTNQSNDSDTDQTEVAVQEENKGKKKHKDKYEGTSTYGDEGTYEDGSSYGDEGTYEGESGS